jgi:toxin HigB-1
MIENFRHRGLKRLFERGEKAQFQADMVEKIENILAMLDRAGRKEDMNLPGFHLHQLKGDLRGSWAVTVRDNWRIVWHFKGSNATDVDFTDYH